MSRRVLMNIVLKIGRSRLSLMFLSSRIFIGSVSILSVSNRAASRPMKKMF